MSNITAFERQILEKKSEKSKIEQDLKKMLQEIKEPKSETVLQSIKRKLSLGKDVKQEFEKLRTNEELKFLTVQANEERIQELDREIRRLTNDLMAMKRAALESRIKPLIQAFKDLQKNQVDILKQLAILYDGYQTAIPTRRQQISSSKMVRVQIVKERKGSYAVATPKMILKEDRKGTMTRIVLADSGETREVKEDICEVRYLELHKALKLQEQGKVTILPDQDIEIERLDGNNSIIVPAMSPPDFIEQLTLLNAGRLFNANGSYPEALREGDLSFHNFLAVLTDKEKADYMKGIEQ